MAVRHLGHVAVGRVVDELAVTHARTTRAQPVQELRAFEGRRVSAVRAHGKWIVVSFDGADQRLGIHLRMSGQLLAREPGDEPDDRHVHARLHLGDRLPGATASVRGDRIGAEWLSGVPAPPPGAPGTGPHATEVWFRDPRTFGELRVLPDGAPVAPDLHDPCVTADTLARDGASRRIEVKAVLLDQLRTVSGIGSYLADEALHRAGISPMRPSESLAVSAWARILDSARLVARDAASRGGVTLPDEGWVDLWSRRGSYAPDLRVHGRPSCATCGTATRSAVAGGRSARWCPRCQDVRRRR